MNLNISSFEQDVLYTHWTYYAIPFCKYNIVLIVARAQYNICICWEHKSVFMHQPPPVFPFEFPAISMKVIIASQTSAVKAAKQAQALQCSQCLLFAGKEHVCKREQEQQAAGNPVCDGVPHNKPSQRDESRSNAASTNCDNSSNHSNNPIVELQLRQNISCV